MFINFIGVAGLFIINALGITTLGDRFDPWQAFGDYRALSVLNAPTVLAAVVQGRSRVHP